MAAASEPASSRGLRRFCRQVKSGAGAACEVGRCAACERALRALVSKSKKQKLLLLLTASAASDLPGGGAADLPASEAKRLTRGAALEYPPARTLHPAPHALRRHRKLHQVQAHRLRRGVPGGLLPRGPELPGDRPG